MGDTGEILKLLYSIQPTVEHMDKALDLLATRMTSAELRAERHDEKIEQQRKDLDALGQKMRERISAPQREFRIRWGEILELLPSLPFFFHFLAGVGTILAVAIGVIWRHIK